jgi:two-component system, NtrC family, nitrogen regulation sensor histidine kinase NtrY
MDALALPWLLLAVLACAVAYLALTRRSPARDGAPGGREELLRAVVETAPMAVLVFGETGRISFSNDEARRLFAEGQPLDGQNFLKLVEQAPETLRQGLVRPTDALFTVEEGGELDTYSLARRTIELGGEAHTLLMVKELTPELGRQQIDVWKNVIRIINHELNNSLAPIASMVHSARLIAKHPEQIGKLDRVFDTIEERTRHLTAFLEGYARFARLPRPRLESVSWASFLDGLRALYPNVQIGEPPPGDGWFDPGQLQQTLINLLKNAIEASNADTGVELGARVASDGSTTLTVADRGSGMTDEVLRSATVPLFSTKERGTGLGLALCREIIEAHRGKLLLARREGGGMEISCWLPGRGTVGPPRTGRLTLTRA